MLRKIFGKRQEIRGGASENYLMRALTIRALHKMLGLLGLSNKDKELDSACRKNGKRSMCICCRIVRTDLKERDYLGDLRIDEAIILKWTVKD